MYSFNYSSSLKAASLSLCSRVVQNSARSFSSLSSIFSPLHFMWAYSPMSGEETGSHAPNSLFSGVGLLRKTQIVYFKQRYFPIKQYLTLASLLGTLTLNTRLDWITLCCLVWCYCRIQTRSQMSDSLSHWETEPKNGDVAGSSAWTWLFLRPTQNASAVFAIWKHHKQVSHSLSLA